MDYNVHFHSTMLWNPHHVNFFLSLIIHGLLNSTLAYFDENVVRQNKHNKRLLNITMKPIADDAL